MLTLAIAAMGAAYPWATLPLAAACALLFATSAPVVGDREWRAFDAALLAAVTVLALQLVPLPADWVARASPATPSLQDALSLDSPPAFRTLSVLPARTRGSLLTAIAALLFFWSARAATAQGAARALARGIAAIGAATALLALVHHLSAPDTIYWWWAPLTPGARPWGPFVDRNHLATFLVMAIPMAVAAAIAAVSGDVQLPWRIRLARALANGRVLGPAVAAGLMLLALLATLSRSGMMSMVIAAAAAAALAPGSRRRRALLLVGGLAVLLVGAATLDSDGLAARVDDTLRPGGPITRVAIWAETLRLGEAFPLAGTGAGTFADAMLQYQRRATEVLFNHAHNEPLQLLAEGGLLLVVPLAVLMAIGAATIRRRLAADPHPGDVIRIGAVAGLCAVAAQSIWETGLRTPSNLLLAALLAAIALRPARPAAAPDDRQ